MRLSESSDDDHSRCHPGGAIAYHAAQERDGRTAEDIAAVLDALSAIEGRLIHRIDDMQNQINVRFDDMEAWIRRVERQISPPVTAAQFESSREDAKPLDAAFQHRADGLYDHLDALKANVDEQFGGVRRMFDQVDRQFNSVDAQFNRIDGQHNKIDGQFNHLHSRFGLLESRLDELTAKLD